MVQKKYSNNKLKGLNARSSSSFIDQNEQKETNFRHPEVLFITSFPPRECGIATYSQDLVFALNNQFNHSFNCVICALETKTENHNYVESPKYILNTDIPGDFMRIANKINLDRNVKVVVMQHEFGFFASQADEYRMFFRSIKKPIVFVFHTVLPNPNETLRLSVIEMMEIASSVIVMTKDAANILFTQYAADIKKIAVIPHGTHLVPPLDRNKLKLNYDISGKMVLSTFGFLSLSKSIETTLLALPKVVEQFPDVLFLVLGKTHPTVFNNEGEKYRNMLEQMVTDLKLENHVRFVNAYLTLPVLLEYLQLSDIYLFTSKDPNQAVSGTFSYAVSCGCPVISTPIPHAREVLSHNNGLIFDFQDDIVLSKSILALLGNDNLRAEISSNSFHKMASTAWQNSAIAHARLFQELTPDSFTLNYVIPPINLNHVKQMTTQIGMVQFAKISIPDLESGYTLDDNARALLAMCQHYELFQEEADLWYIAKYIEFIKNCFGEKGRFLNYLSHSKEFTSQNKQENLDDSNGRAIWALGYVASLTDLLPDTMISDAQQIIQKALPELLKIYSTRAMAFIIKGLHCQGKPQNKFALTIFANRLEQMYLHESTQEWKWFEDSLTYGNSLLSEAMLCSYLSTGNVKHKAIAIESFDFLLSKIIVGDRIKVVSNKGWLQKNAKANENIGGEQPIDVAYTVLALEKFFNLTQDSTYKDKSKIAFNWFLGENHLHQIVYNPCTGGCYDGVEEFDINLNQGAESTLSYLLARLSIERVNMRLDASTMIKQELNIPVKELESPLIAVGY